MSKTNENKLIQFQNELQAEGYNVTMTDLESLPSYFWKYPKGKQIYLFEIKKEEESKGRKPSMDELLGIFDCIPSFHFREKRNVEPSMNDSNITNEKDKKLLKFLNNLRHYVGNEHKIQTFHICDYSTLVEMVIKKPKTLEEMKKIRGMGEVRIKKYGEMFLEALKEYDKDCG